MAEAQGRDVDGENATATGDVSRKHQYITEILKWRAQANPEQNLYTLLNNKNHVAGTMTAIQLYKRAEKFAQVCYLFVRISIKHIW